MMAETINDKEEIAELSTSDTFPMWDTDGACTRKLSVGDLFESALAGLFPISWEALYTDVEFQEPGSTEYTFYDTQVNNVLYVSDITGSTDGTIFFDVTLPPNPVEGQEVIITYDCADGNQLEVDFLDSPIAGSTDNIDLEDTVDMTMPGTPYVHLKWNERDGLWWKLSMQDQDP